jgi:predicted RNA methylase
MASRKQLQLFDDHYDMLADEVRMKAYAEAIGRTVRPGDRVLDLGAGLGILGFMALRAGAAHVYSVEKTDSIELARKIAERNGLSDRVTFFHGNSKDFVLDEPVDVLLSETLGSFGVEENTLDFTLDARRRLLKPGGRLLPEALRLWLAPVSQERAWRKVGFWQEVQGLDFSPAVDELQSRMSPADIGMQDLMARPQVFHDVDLALHEQTTLQNTLLFPVARPGTLYGIAGWFQVELCPGVQISTGPEAPPTHWRQAVFPLREPIGVVAGDFLEVTLKVGPAGPRSDDTVVELDYRCTQVSTT